MNTVHLLSLDYKYQYEYRYSKHLITWIKFNVNSYWLLLCNQWVLFTYWVCINNTLAMTKLWPRRNQNLGGILGGLGGSFQQRCCLLYIGISFEIYCVDKSTSLHWKWSQGRVGHLITSLRNPISFYMLSALIVLWQKIPSKQGQCHVFRCPEAVSLYISYMNIRCHLTCKRMSKEAK